jgi:predicted Zn-dependent protease
MPQPVPAHVETFNAIIRELNILVHERPDEFTLIRRLGELEKQALDMKSQSAAYSLSALGSIAAARGSIKKMHEYHKKSIALLGADPVILLNYGASLGNAGLLDEAWDFASRYMREHPDDLRGQDQLTEIAFDKGDEALFLEQARTWKRLTGEDHRLYADYLAERGEARELSTLCTAASAPALNRIAK